MIRNTDSWGYKIHYFLDTEDFLCHDNKTELSVFCIVERSKAICKVIPYEATDTAVSSCTIGILKTQTTDFIFIRYYVYSIILGCNCLHYIQSIFPS